MPTYEYRCRDCGRDFEVFQRMSEQPGAPCPDCGHGAERLISGGAGLLFKGDGFYITDYRSEDYRKRAREEAGAGAGESARGAGGGNAGSDSSGDAVPSSSSSRASGKPGAEGGSAAGKAGGKAASATRSSDGGTAAQGG
ncbi:MAG: zinc ribbon domain-containing protein [Gemmatimonadetes bacterium]|nr:zinc ribbon domain-containing protein [Gemmatimonadota bacterium]MYE17342.1 zinc ribbon domain-containing protein [Gemmatimonadota bacterium]MYG21489.1 zinc ribbon domain-containing protein [Gemmatimonadota bacterium]MYJ38097.1 zinc ribbon domain-containing protein [Gemmatimonadota bacterium]